MSASDIVYGRQGGRFIPAASAQQQDHAFRLAIAEGRIVVARCRCTRWWITPGQVGDACLACGGSMLAV